MHSRIGFLLCWEAARYDLLLYAFVVRVVRVLFMILCFASLVRVVCRAFHFVVDKTADCVSIYDHQSCLLCCCRNAGCQSAVLLYVVRLSSW